MAGIDQPDRKTNDKSELAQFLSSAGVDLTQVNIAIPPEYLRPLVEAGITSASPSDKPPGACAAQDQASGEVVDGEIAP
jgi:hypothetical protein